MPIRFSPPFPRWRPGLSRRPRRHRHLCGERQHAVARPSRRAPRSPPSSTSPTTPTGTCPAASAAPSTTRCRSWARAICRSASSCCRRANCATSPAPAGTSAQLRTVGGVYDNCWVLDGPRGELKHGLTLKDPVSGRTHGGVDHRGRHADVHRRTLGRRLPRQDRPPASNMAPSPSSRRTSPTRRRTRISPAPCCARARFTATAWSGGSRVSAARRAVTPLHASSRRRPGSRSSAVCAPAQCGLPTSHDARCQGLIPRSSGMPLHPRLTLRCQASKCLTGNYTDPHPPAAPASPWASRPSATAAGTPAHSPRASP